MIWNHGPSIILRTRREPGDADRGCEPSAGRESDDDEYRIAVDLVFARAGRLGDSALSYRVLELEHDGLGFTGTAQSY